MTVVAPRPLVIDACVARACGDVTSSHEVATACRVFLDTVQKVGHSVVLTQRILIEWEREASTYALTWLQHMVSRKCTRFVPLAGDEAMLDAILAATPRAEQQRAIRHDYHLVAAACAADAPIASLDETARYLFAMAAIAVAVLRTVVWVNPSMSEEDAISWLRDGANSDEERQLGSFPLWQPRAGRPAR